MTPRAFITLFLVTALAVAGAVAAILSEPESASVAALDRPAFPDLADDSEDIAAIEITERGETYRLERTVAGDWAILPAAGYPADDAKVRRFLLNLRDLRLAEPKTSKPELYDHLGLGDPESPESAARRVVLREADGEAVLSARIGQAAGRPIGDAQDGVFILRAGEDQSWLAAGTVALPTRPLNWADRQVLHLPAPQVRRVDVDPAEGAPFAVEREEPGSTDFTLMGALEGLKGAVDPTEITNLANLLTYVNVEDVARADDQPPPEGARKITLTAFSGIEVTALTWKADDKNWIAMSAALTEESEGGEGEMSEARAFVERLEARAAGWSFALSDGFYQRYEVTLESLKAEAPDS